MTLKNALFPYNEEPGPRMISTRSTKSISSRKSVCVKAESKTGSLPMSVNVDQHAPAKITGPVYPAHADGIVNAVVGHVKSPHGTQQVPECAVTVLFDILLGEDGDG